MFSMWGWWPQSDVALLVVPHNAIVICIVFIFSLTLKGAKPFNLTPFITKGSDPLFNVIPLFENHPLS